MGSSSSKHESDGPFGQWAATSPYDGQFKYSPVLRSKLVDVTSAPPVKDSEGNSTLWPFMASALAKNAGRQAVGWRKLLKREMEDIKGKKFEKLTLAPTFDFWTSSQLADAAKALGAGLVVKTGMKPGDKVLIFAETQRDWMVAALAIFRQGGIVVTAYATLGEEGVTTSLNQTEATTCICDAKLFKTLAASAPHCPTLKHVVTIIAEGAEDAETEISSSAMAAKLGSKMDVFSIGELQQAGRAQPVEAAAGVNPEDAAVIMYTSGTTGSSKGVVISHKAAIAMTLSYPMQLPVVTKEDSYIGYLPLAHIMELCVEFWLLSIGCLIGYGSPHTLTDTGVKLKAGCRRVAYMSLLSRPLHVA